MPKKGKKGSRPAIQHNNESLRRDIEAGRPEMGVIDPFADDFEDGTFDIADELLAALAERDAKDSTANTAASGNDKEAVSITSNSSNTTKSPGNSHSGLRGAGERLVNGLRHPFEHHHNESAIDDTTSPSGSPSTSHTRKESIRKLFSSSPKSPEPSPIASGELPKKKVSRQQARKDRKAAEVAEMVRQAQAEVAAGVASGQVNEVEQERQGIDAMCKALNVQVHEIVPDGHCLYAAVADQLNLKGKVGRLVDYRATRRATAEEMRRNPDEYKPFISDSDEHMAGIENREAGTLNSEQAQDRYFLDYCAAVENTGVWGGQPEILALSRAFKTQIHVVQSGLPVLKVGDGEFKDGDPVVISYHRKMYGLGEHYNSLRPLPPHL